MLASNQPYQRVDDGVGAGFIGGSLAGAAVAGATHRWGQQGIEDLRGINRNRMANSQASMRAIRGTEGVSSSDSIGAQRNHAINIEKGNKRMKNLSTLEGLHNKGFGGGWKGKALAYGGSVIAGGLLGMGADALND